MNQYTTQFNVPSYNQITAVVMGLLVLASFYLVISPLGFIPQSPLYNSVAKFPRATTWLIGVTMLYVSLDALRYRIAVLMEDSE